jgi:LytR cell envelope-related transcriptional attenuator
VRAFSRRLWHDPALGAALSITEVLVRNRSGDSDLGSQVSARLEALGYEVDPTDKGSILAETRIIDQSGGTADVIVAKLIQDLGLPALEMAEAAAADPKRVILELGKDAVGVVRTDLPPTEASVPRSAGGVSHVGSWSP